MLKREQTASAPMLKAWDRVDLGMFMEHKRVLQQSSLSTFHIISMHGEGPGTAPALGKAVWAPTAKGPLANDDHRTVTLSG